MYKEAIDTLVNAMKDRFYQPGLIRFENVEQLLLKAINHQDFASEFEVVKSDFRGDFNVK